MTTRYRFIHFEQVGDHWTCRTNRNNDLLGTVEWFVRWREWEYVPQEGTGYSVGCLRDMADFLAQLNAQPKGETP
jgi:hypothetical protein